MPDNNEQTSLRADFVADTVELLIELTGTILKVVLAYYVLRHIGTHPMPSGDALATATLLGATDFFARRGKSRFVHDLKQRVMVRLPDGSVIEKDIDDHEEEK